MIDIVEARGKTLLDVIARIEERRSESEEDATIRLMTAHASKGLEFTNVLVDVHVAPACRAHRGQSMSSVLPCCVVVLGREYFWRAVTVVAAASRCWGGMPAADYAT